MATYTYYDRNSLTDRESGWTNPRGIVLNSDTRGYDMAPFLDERVLTGICSNPVKTTMINLFPHHTAQRGINTSAWRMTGRTNYRTTTPSQRHLRLVLPQTRTHPKHHQSASQRKQQNQRHRREPTRRDPLLG